MVRLLLVVYDLDAYRLINDYRLLVQFYLETNANAAIRLAELSYTVRYTHFPYMLNTSLSTCRRVLEQFNGRFLSKVPTCFSEQFQVLAKCSIKFDCLVKEMLFMRKL